MNDTQADFNYVKQALLKADTRHSYPLIYVLWGMIVLAGFSIAEFNLQYINQYWLVVTPIGIVISAWLGYRQDKQLGQQNARAGNLYLRHFIALTAVIFVAMFTGQYQSILLIIGLGYLLAGIHLDKPMLWIGCLTIITHLAVQLGQIQSNLVIGVVLAAGLFVAAWSSAKANSEPS